MKIDSNPRDPARHPRTRSLPRSRNLSGLLPLAALIALASFSLSRPAQALLGDRLETFGIDGSLRTTTLATKNTWQWKGQPHNGGDGLSEFKLRLIAGGEPLSGVKFEIHGVQSLSVVPPSPLPGEGGGAGLMGASAGGKSWRLHPTSWSWGEDGGDVQARLWLDRCELKIATEYVDVVLGRQAVSFGKAWFWNPLDVFAAFTSLELDRDYKPGVDALRLDLPLSEGSGLTLVLAMGDLKTQKLSNNLGGVLRLTTTLAGFDWALQGGRIRDAWQAGAALSGEIDPIDLRAEFSWERPDIRESSAALTHPEAGEHLQGVLGVSRRFENTLSLSAELLVHNGGPDDLMARMALSQNRTLLQASRVVSGLNLSYELLPVLVGSLAVLTTWDEPSGLIQPGLSWSAGDEVDVVIGGMFSLGPRPEMTPIAPAANLYMPTPRSELGTYPHMFWARVVASF